MDEVTVDAKEDEMVVVVVTANVKVLVSLVASVYQTTAASVVLDSRTAPLAASVCKMAYQIRKMA
jgi:CO dehydrogenase/acetyl-CoA synthase gamma subunit (corrinoid Fe-S protein)